MKSINEYLNTNDINESVTELDAINNYGKTWTTEHPTIEFEDMIKNFLEGALVGLEDNLRAYGDSDTDVATIEADTKLVKKLLDIIDHPVMWR